MPRPLRRLKPLLWLLLGAIAMGVFLARRPAAIGNGQVESTRSRELSGAAQSRSVPLPALIASAVPPAVDARALFQFETPPDAARLDAGLPAPARLIHYVRLNTALIAGKQSPFWKKAGTGRVVVPLPDGGALTVVIDESTMLGANRFTSAGHLEGRPESRAVFAWNEGFLHASIDDAELGSFALRAATETFSQFYRVDPALVGACGGARTPVIDSATLAAAAASHARAAELAASPSTSQLTAAATENAQHAEVHVMMAYTQSVLAATMTGAARTAALQSAFDAAIAKVNADFAASAITARVKLVGIAETQYDENAAATGTVQDTALTALYLTNDGKMDELHARRDQVGADLVCLALARADFASTGLAFVLNQPNQITNGLFGFSVVQYDVIAGTSLVSHELGHNFGCAHDREHAAAPGAYPYSYGYRFLASNARQYHDIMSYDPGVGLSYFSNPRLTAPAPAPANSPGGIEAGSPGESDTARTIEQDAFEVSTYRLQTQAVASSGTLLNVSTQAFAGTGDQALIAGFIIGGPTPKPMLLRAAGPALNAFSVTGGALPDPILYLYSGATVVQTNDNWSMPTNGATVAEVTAATAQAGALPFVNGSLDSALLVTLAPGPYTMLIRGAGVTSGTALIEAYEIGAGANRVVNLSTRGYADDKDHPMVSGFVVSAASGTTKRVLIRVRGPSLTRDFAITNGMNDPCIELRDSAGHLLLKNDDWSTGTVAGTASAVNDFSPSVRFYSEQQIAATGLAPANRRESCVLVDLPAGAYTIVTKPFEQRDPDPELDEPAAPGIALVEVFEIGR